MYKWIWMIHDISINILWQVIIPYEESYQPAMGPRWVSTTFWLCRAVCGSDHGGNHRGVGETKEQTKCLSKLVKRLQVPKMRRIWCFCFTRNFGADEIDRIYIYIYWYEIHIWWGYTPWDPRGGCFCVFNLSSTFQRLEPFPSCASALRWKFTGNGCDASRGSIEASFESSWANWCPQSFIIIPNWQFFMEFLKKKILADFFLGFRDSFC